MHQSLGALAVCSVSCLTPACCCKDNFNRAADGRKCKRNCITLDNNGQYCEASVCSLVHCSDGFVFSKLVAAQRSLSGFSCNRDGTLACYQFTRLKSSDKHLLAAQVFYLAFPIQQGNVFLTTLVDDFDLFCSQGTLSVRLADVVVSATVVGATTS